ncbi:5'-nucleotidase C-terminal domain-containing protein [soil metagenome]
MPDQSLPARRSVLTGAAALAAVGFVPGAASAAQPSGKHRTRLTVLGTTDLHGNVFNWDYFKNAEYDDKTHNDIGVAKAATLIKAVRAQRAGEPLLTLDAGDTIQGTPLAYYYAKVDPITQGSTHPMAAAMNAIGYDAAALGNHEFNYGLDTLREFQRQVHHPLLGANAVDDASGLPAFPPYIVKTFKPKNGPKITVGILGLTNPGIAIWDKANVSGRLRFPGLVEQAKVFVPRMKKSGCDVIVVAAHSGATTGSSYGDTLPYPENASSLLASEVPGIDAILVGHAHVEIPQRYVANTSTGRDVLLSEPLYWGMRVTVMDLELEQQGSGWKVAQATSQVLDSNTVDEDPSVAGVVRAQHDQVVTYVNSPIGTSTQAMSAQRAVVEDVPAIDFINYVQADAVHRALAGTADADLATLSIAAPFNRAAAIPQGQVSLRDVAGLYIYDNTLLGIKVTGQQVLDYLEFSARYYQQQTGGTTFSSDQVTNAVTATAPAPNGTPDYNYDIVAGLSASLAYDIDIAQPVGSRIKDLTYAGAPIDPAQVFVMAINNYRQSGGGGFPGVTTAPVVYNAQVEIRQLLIDYVTAQGTIDPATFASVDWRLVANGQPVTIT